MTDAIDVACPECQKKIRATAELQGKKVRCKGCSHVFTIPTAATKEAPAKAKVAAKAGDEDDVSAYGFSQEEEKVGLPRCPHCAMEMQSDTARVCLHCGYDTATRQRIATRKVYEATAAERLSWLMPGFIALGTIFGLMIFDLFFCLALPRLIDENSDWYYLTHASLRLWGVIGSILIMLALAKFAWSRLIMNPTPPERVRT